MLKAGEMKPRGYEYKSVICGWIEGEAVGQRVRADGLPCRVRAAARATKAIATRATVRIVVDDGIVERTIRCDSGLSAGQLEAAVGLFTERVKALRGRTAIPKYIMLEIQRGPNDF